MDEGTDPGMLGNFSGAGNKNLCKRSEDKARSGDSHLQSQHFGRPRWVDHLRPGVQDQPDQHGGTPSLLKIQN